MYVSKSYDLIGPSDKANQARLTFMKYLKNWIIKFYI